MFLFYRGYNELDLRLASGLKGVRAFYLSRTTWGNNILLVLLLGNWHLCTNEARKVKSNVYKALLAGPYWIYIPCCLSRFNPILTGGRGGLKKKTIFNNSLNYLTFLCQNVLTFTTCLFVVLLLTFICCSFTNFCKRVPAFLSPRCEDRSAGDELGSLKSWLILKLPAETT